MNYRYHICIPNENTVKVKKWTPDLKQPDEASGTFRQSKITSQIQTVFQNPENLQGEQIQKIGEALFEGNRSGGVKQLRALTQLKN